MPSHPRNIWIDNDLWDRAFTLSEESGVSRGKIVNTALNLYLSTATTSSVQADVQMTVDASGPSHREPPQRVKVKGGVDPDDVAF